MLTMFQVKNQTKEKRHALIEVPVPSCYVPCEAPDWSFMCLIYYLLCSSWQDGDGGRTSISTKLTRTPSGEEKDSFISKALHVDESMSQEVNGFNLLEDKAARAFHIGVGPLYI